MRDGPAQFDRRTVMAGGLALAAVPVGRGEAASPLSSAFRRPDGAQPIIGPDPQSVFFCPMRKAPVRWRALHAFNPAAVVHDDAVYVLFRAEDDSGAMQIGGHTSRLGLARSTDGLRFEVLPTPVLYPDADDQRGAEWDGGCEDPRLAVREDGSFVCTYTQYSRTAIHLGVATSRDLVFWTKHGSAFAGTRYADMMTKSAAIVHRLVDDRLVAARIGGSYWMLFGQGTLHAAWSEDMIRWTPVESAPGKLAVVMAPRPGRFDSALVEAGPPPVLTARGIVMLYNAKNAATGGDPARPPLEYAAGRALLDPRDPTRVLERADAPVFAPEYPWERSGQYAAGTTFIEGLVRFNGEWLLYYGAADSVVGVARSAGLAL
jgi:beta-1,2-mannosidase